MVLSETYWLVRLGILIGRLDSFLRKYCHEEFFVCFFISFDDTRCAFRWYFHFSFALSTGSTTILSSRNNMLSGTDLSSVSAVGR